MSLFKQIALLVTGAFLLLFASVTFDNSQKFGLFLRGQMQTTAKDTATVLGMAISTTGTGHDLVALETMFSAVFDSGYYSQIRLVGEDGHIIHQKQRDLGVYGVPDWFIQAIPLDAATGSANVMAGWTQLGMLYITLHPGYAYTNLYQGLKTTLAWFSMLFLLVLGLLWYLLHVVLKPLKSLHHQATAIQENEFIVQPIIPRTIEFREVVQAMNRLVTKVKHVFEDQQQTLRQYHDLLYRDKLTGLRNRRFILSELDNAISESSPYQGCMVIVQIQGLDKLREQKGYTNADNVIEALAAIIVDLFKDRKDDKYARLSGEEFSLLACMSIPEAQNMIEEIFDRFKQDVYGNEHAIFVALNSAFVSLNASITDVHDGDSQRKILSDLDLALAQAQVDGSFKQRFSMSNDLDLPEGKMEWRNWFRTMLDDRNFYLVAQPVFDLDQQCLHREVFVRANDNQGKLVPAGIFMPMALTLGYSLEIDCAVFSLLKRISSENTDGVPLALNLSTGFFSNSYALDSFIQLLDHYKKHSVTLYVETTHSTLQQYPERCNEVFSAVKQSGQRFGVDQLDLNLPLQLLQSIKPQYVKVAAKVLDDISGESVSAAYQALRSMTSTLDIKLIAVGVDSQALHDRMLELHIDAMQGNLLAPPEVIS